MQTRAMMHRLYLAQLFVEIRCSSVGRCVGFWIVHISILEGEMTTVLLVPLDLGVRSTQLMKYAWMNLTKSTVICSEMGIRLLNRMKKVKNV